MARPTGERMRFDHQYSSAVGRCAIVPAMSTALRMQPGTVITIEFGDGPGEPMAVTETLTIKAIAVGQLDDLLREHAASHFLRTKEWGRHSDPALVGSWPEHLRKLIAKMWGEPTEGEDYVAIHFN